MSQWTPDQDIVKQLREKAKNGADLGELLALTDFGSIKQIAYFVHTFHIPLREMKGVVSWAELNHTEAVEQRHKVSKMIQSYLASSSADGDEI